MKPKTKHSHAYIFTFNAENGLKIGPSTVNDGADIRRILYASEFDLNKTGSVNKND